MLDIMRVRALTRASRGLEQLFLATGNTRWEALKVVLTANDFAVEQCEGSATHWAVYYPGLPETPIQIIVVHHGCLKPKYISMLRKLVRMVLEETEGDQV